MTTRPEPGGMQPQSGESKEAQSERTDSLATRPDGHVEWLAFSKDGVLEIRMPKPSAEAASRRIQIQRG